MNSIILCKSCEFTEVLKNVFKRFNFLEMIRHLACDIEWLQCGSLELKIRYHLFVMWMKEACLSVIDVSFQL